MTVCHGFLAPETLMKGQSGARGEGEEESKKWWQRKKYTKREKRNDEDLYRGWDFDLGSWDLHLRLKIKIMILKTIGNDL